MKRLLVLFFLSGIANGFTQSITLQNGTTQPADGLVRRDDMVMVTIKTPSGGVGQIGLNVSDIARLNLPAPAALTDASNDVASGEYDQALALIQPVVAYQKTIRDIPGNYWAKAALIELSAFCGLQRDEEARALANEITTTSHDPVILSAAKLEITMITKFNDPRDALVAYDALIGQSKEPQILSQAWIAEGDIRLAQHEFDEALLAYLTVIVLYPDHNPLVPKALWGSGQAYDKLKDTVNATATYRALISDYPDTPEASLAKAELIKKEKKT